MGSFVEAYLGLLRLHLWCVPRGFREQTLTFVREYLEEEDAADLEGEVGTLTDFLSRHEDPQMLGRRIQINFWKTSIASALLRILPAIVMMFWIALTIFIRTSQFSFDHMTLVTFSHLTIFCFFISSLRTFWKSKAWHIRLILLTSVSTLYGLLWHYFLSISVPPNYSINLIFPIMLGLTYEIIDHRYPIATTFLFSMTLTTCLGIEVFAYMRRRGPISSESFYSLFSSITLFTLAIWGIFLAVWIGEKIRPRLMAKMLLGAEH